MQTLAGETIDRIRVSLDDDLNTAQAQAAIFEMVRSANSALDLGQIKKDDAVPLLAGLEKFDEIFAVLKDDDLPKMRSTLDWARTEGREKEISPELMEIAGSARLSDEEVNRKLAEMEAARKARNFQLSDAIRAEILTAGIIVENTKDGVRWRKK
jgi:cysteinyl-tRNA synthetase